MFSLETFLYLMFCMNVIPSRPAMFAVIIAASTTSSSPKLLTMLPLKEVIHHSVVLGAACNSYGSRNRTGVCPCCKSLVCSWLWLSLGPCSRCQYNRHVGISCILSVLFQVGAERVLPEHCFSLQHTRNAHSTNTYGVRAGRRDREREKEKGRLNPSSFSSAHSVIHPLMWETLRYQGQLFVTVICSTNFATKTPYRYAHWPQIPRFVQLSVSSACETHVGHPLH